jgi:hypothetical protein
LTHYVRANLKREKCFFWVFCSWPVIAYGQQNYAASAFELTGVAKTDCRWQKGWYMGQGFHTTIAPNGNRVDSKTTSRVRRLWCW